MSNNITPDTTFNKKFYIIDASNTVLIVHFFFLYERNTADGTTDPVEILRNAEFPSAFTVKSDVFCLNLFG